MSRVLVRVLLAAGLCLHLAACGDDDSCDPAEADACELGEICQAGDDGNRCVPGCALDAPRCPENQSCEEVEGGEPMCFGQVAIQGRVVQAANPALGIADARLAARDEGGAVVGKVATSAADGAYLLPLPVKRSADGTPLKTIYTLRADAATYASFPGGLRPALPLDVSTAVKQADGTWRLENAATTVGLLALPSAADLGTVRGRVDAPSPAGTLVVAGPVTAVADPAGEFVVFNVPAGDVTVKGYIAGVQLTPAQIVVPAGREVANVVLTRSAAPLATVTGSIQTKNAPTFTKTSVVLVAEETFIEALEVGEVPRGLRASDVTNTFSIAGVPDGRYVILASLDNDGSVRDPDTSISGTALVRLEVAGGAPSVTNPSFSVTDALAVIGPGKDSPETVTGTPTFRWADDSSEDRYELVVFDAFGNKVWEKLDVPGVSGSAEVAVAYAGAEALKPGMVYQFRATSIRRDVPISRTEQLRGVFSVQ